MPKEFKGHIFVVDDDQEMRILLQRHLGNEGYRVSLFEFATEALAALSESDVLRDEVDMIFSDLRMAEMDGMEFLRRMRSVGPEIPVVLATAYGSIDTAIEAMRIGAYHYVVKPLKLSEISVLVERAAALLGKTSFCARKCAKLGNSITLSAKLRPCGPFSISSTAWPTAPRTF